MLRDGGASVLTGSFVMVSMTITVDVPGGGAVVAGRTTGRPRPAEAVGRTAECALPEVSTAAGDAEVDDAHTAG